jgi:hypothetical protein
MFPRLRLINKDANLKPLEAFLDQDQYSIQVHNNKSILLCFIKIPNKKQQLLFNIWFAGNQYRLD